MGVKHYKDEGHYNEQAENFKMNGRELFLLIRECKTDSSDPFDNESAKNCFNEFTSRYLQPLDSIDESLPDAAFSDLVKLIEQARECAFNIGFKSAVQLIVTSLS